jgi:GxxExxY protein
MKPQGKLYQERLTGDIIGAAIEIHRQLGPGLLESTYAVCAESLSCGVLVSSVRSPCRWNTKASDSSVVIVSIYSVAGLVIVEIKSIEALAPIHEAQLLTYLKLTGVKIGLLINFNVVVLKSGIRRLVH